MRSVKALSPLVVRSIATAAAFAPGTSFSICDGELAGCDPGFNGLLIWLVLFFVLLGFGSRQFLRGLLLITFVPLLPALFAVAGGLLGAALFGKQWGATVIFGLAGFLLYFKLVPLVVDRWGSEDTNRSADQERKKSVGIDSVPVPEALQAASMTRGADPANRSEAGTMPARADPECRAIKKVSERAVHGRTPISEVVEPRSEPPPAVVHTFDARKGMRKGSLQQRSADNDRAVARRRLAGVSCRGI